MKKLMIVAAVAAMVGGAKAEDYVYDFSATLTTTSGKEGKDISTTHYVGLGKNDKGDWWYDDGVFSAVYTVGKKKFKDFVYNTKDANDKPVTITIKQALQYGNKQYPWKLNKSAVKTDDDKAIIAEALGWTAYDPYSKDPAPRKVTGTTKYDNQQMYKNKWVWCETFSFKVITDADCYRDTAKLTIKGYVLADEICVDDNPAIFVEDNGDVYDFNYKFVNFFGSQVSEKATKVEALFDISDGMSDIDTADGTNLYFVLAGQGKYSDKLGKDSLGYYAWGISSISGNIVGYLPAPTCEACCDDPLAAIAFECANSTLTAAYDLPTAAYGTWSMKFNKKYSDILQ